MLKKNLQIPRQPNSFDCGVCIIRCAALVTRRTEVPPEAFSPKALLWARRVLSAEMVLPEGLSIREWMYSDETRELIEGRPLLPEDDDLFHPLAESTVASFQAPLLRQVKAFLELCESAQGAVRVVSRRYHASKSKKEQYRPSSAEVQSAFGTYTQTQEQAGTLLGEVQTVYDEYMDIKYSLQDLLRL
jgi:hypothetical protein